MLTQPIDSPSRLLPLTCCGCLECQVEHSVAAGGPRSRPSPCRGPVDGACAVVDGHGGAGGEMHRARAHADGARVAHA